MHMHTYIMTHSIYVHAIPCIPSYDYTMLFLSPVSCVKTRGFLGQVWSLAVTLASAKATSMSPGW